jgi:hypothetical protein
MKKIISLMLLVSLVVSCDVNDWLDVKPRGQVESSKFFETQDGYKMALNGVYIQLADAGLYGRDVTMYFPELLAHNFAISSDPSNIANRIGNYDYTYSSVESKISSIFQNYYKAIAQLNDILENLENENGNKFTYNNDKLLRGECLGLRAFLHLDVLRYFGPVPSEASGSEKAIPYVKEVTNDPNTLVSMSYQDVINNITADLDAAEEILKEYDPIVKLSIESLQHTFNVGFEGMPNDEWQFMRQGRFNYYAVLATKARLYHWIGDKSKAVQYAEAVVNSGKLSLVNGSNINNSLDMYPEHIFGLENTDLQEIVEPLFGSNTSTLTQTTIKLNMIYESYLHVNDIRFANNRYWKEKTLDNGGTINLFFKYTGNQDVEADNRIPLIRLAEMYFILIEDLPLEEAKPYFVEFRIARALTSSIDETATTDENALLLQLEKEYRKDFMGEGQMFFFYKKHNYSRFTTPEIFTVPTGGYVLPKPKGQTNFEQ